MFHLIKIGCRGAFKLSYSPSSDLDNSGSPVIKISIYGISKAKAKEFNAIVDTGFTGFLAMPW